MFLLTLVLVGALSVTAAAPGFAQVPAKMSYQGLLLDSGGSPVTATVDLTFSIWDASACGGGALKWGPEVHNGVVVANGVFTVLLGDAGMPLTDPPLAFDAPCWLEVEVGTDPPLCPRVELVSVPSALMARTVEDGAITTSKIQDFTVTADDLADGAVTKSKLAPGAINPSNLALPFSASVPSFATLWDLSNVGVGSAGRFKAGSLLPALVVENTGGGPALATSGDLEVGLATDFDSIDLNGAGSAGPIWQARTEAGGGATYGFDEDQFFTYGLEPDADGEGGRLFINRTQSAVGFVVDGNFANSSSARLSIGGELQGLSLDMSTSGNNSVILPSEAIAAFEMLDEPGVASRTSNPAGGIALTGVTSDLLVRSINAPTDGFVFVIATFQANLTHINGTDSFANFGISDVSATFPSNQDVSARLDGATPSGIYSLPVTVHGLFSVSAGANTFYLVGREITTSDVTAFEIQLSLLFFPTAYGVVESTFTAAGDDVETFGAAPISPATASDIAAEQSEARAFHLARLQREMDATRAQVERIQAELANEIQKGDRR